MDDLKIKKDGKTIFDSQGPILQHHDSLEVMGIIVGDITSPKSTSEILVNIKTLPSSSSKLVEDELNHSVTKL
jgi:hypothetical protein